jgi:hypothetical protein
MGSQEVLQVVSNSSSFLLPIFLNPRFYSSKLICPGQKRRLQHIYFENVQRLIFKRFFLWWANQRMYITNYCFWAKDFVMGFSSFPPPKNLWDGARTNGLKSSNYYYFFNISKSDDFGWFFFPKKILCMSLLAAFFFMSSDKNLPKQKKKNSWNEVIIMHKTI